MLLRNMSMASTSVYFGITVIMGAKVKDWFDCSTKELSEITGRSTSTIRRGLDDLVSYGILEKTERPGHTTLYRVIEEVPLMTPEERKEFDEFQELCSNMTPEELDEFAKKNGDEIIIIKFPKS